MSAAVYHSGGRRLSGHLPCRSHIQSAQTRVWGPEGRPKRLPDPGLLSLCRGGLLCLQCRREQLPCSRWQCLSTAMGDLAGIRRAVSFCPFGVHQCCSVDGWLLLDNLAKPLSGAGYGRRITMMRPSTCSEDNRQYWMHNCIASARADLAANAQDIMAVNGMTLHQSAFVVG